MTTNCLPVVNSKTSIPVQNLVIHLVVYDTYTYKGNIDQLLGPKRQTVNLEPCISGVGVVAGLHGASDGRQQDKTTGNSRLPTTCGRRSATCSSPAGSQSLKGPYISL